MMPGGRRGRGCGPHGQRGRLTSPSHHPYHMQYSYQQHMFTSPPNYQQGSNYQQTSQWQGHGYNASGGSPQGHHRMDNQYNYPGGSPHSVQVGTYQQPAQSYYHSGVTPPQYLQQPVHSNAGPHHPQPFHPHAQYGTPGMEVPQPFHQQLPRQSPVSPSPRGRFTRSRDARRQNERSVSFQSGIASSLRSSQTDPYVTKAELDSAKHRIQNLQSEIECLRSQIGTSTQGEADLPAKCIVSAGQHPSALDIKSNEKGGSRNRRPTYPGSLAPELSQFGGEKKNSLFDGEKKNGLFNAGKKNTWVGGEQTEGEQKRPWFVMGKNDTLAGKEMKEREKWNTAFGTDRKSTESNGDKKQHRAVGVRESPIHTESVEDFPPLSPPKPPLESFSYAQAARTLVPQRESGGESPERQKNHSTPPHGATLFSEIVQRGHEKTSRKLTSETLPAPPTDIAPDVCDPLQLQTPPARLLSPTSPEVSIKLSLDTNDPQQFPSLPLDTCPRPSAPTELMHSIPGAAHKQAKQVAGKSRTSPKTSPKSQEIYIPLVANPETSHRSIDTGDEAFEWKTGSVDTTVVPPATSLQRMENTLPNQNGTHKLAPAATPKSTEATANQQDDRTPSDVEILHQTSPVAPKATAGNIKNKATSKSFQFNPRAPVFSFTKSSGVSELQGVGSDFSCGKLSGVLEPHAPESYFTESYLNSKEDLAANWTPPSLPVQYSLLTDNRGAYGGTVYYDNTAYNETWATDNPMMPIFHQFNDLEAYAPPMHGETYWPGRYYPSSESRVHGSDDPSYDGGFDFHPPYDWRNASPRVRYPDESLPLGFTPGDDYIPPLVPGSSVVSFPELESQLTSRSGTEANRNFTQDGVFPHKMRGQEEQNFAQEGHGQYKEHTPQHEYGPLDGIQHATHQEHGTKDERPLETLKSASWAEIFEDETPDADLGPAVTTKPPVIQGTAAEGVQTMTKKSDIHPATEGVEVFKSEEPAAPDQMLMSKQKPPPKHHAVLPSVALNAAASTFASKYKPIVFGSLVGPGTADSGDKENPTVRQATCDETPPVDKSGPTEENNGLPDVTVKKVSREKPGRKEPEWTTVDRFGKSRRIKETPVVAVPLTNTRPITHVSAPPTRSSSWARIVSSSQPATRPRREVKSRSVERPKQPGAVSLQKLDAKRKLYIENIPKNITYEDFLRDVKGGLIDDCYVSGLSPDLHQHTLITKGHLRKDDPWFGYVTFVDEEGTKKCLQYLNYLMAPEGPQQEIKQLVYKPNVPVATMNLKGEQVNLYLRERDQRDLQPDVIDVVTKQQGSRVLLFTFRRNVNTRAPNVGNPVTWDAWQRGFNKEDGKGALELLMSAIQVFGGTPNVYTELVEFLPIEDVQPTTVSKFKAPKTFLGAKDQVYRVRISFLRVSIARKVKEVLERDSSFKQHCLITYAPDHCAESINIPVVQDDPLREDGAKKGGPKAPSKKGTDGVKPGSAAVKEGGSAAKLAAGDSKKKYHKGKKGKKLPLDAEDFPPLPEFGRAASASDSTTRSATPAVLDGSVLGDTSPIVNDETSVDSSKNTAGEDD